MEGRDHAKAISGCAAIATAFVGMAVVANAADLPVAPAPAYKAAAIVAPIFSWTGFYLGGNLGAGWQNGTVTDSVHGFNWGTNNNATFVGGGQIGAKLSIWQLRCRRRGRL
jgi:outer membrane immunogenic protein